MYCPELWRGCRPQKTSYPINKLEYVQELDFRLFFSGSKIEIWWDHSNNSSSFLFLLYVQSSLMFDWITRLIDQSILCYLCNSILDDSFFFWHTEKLFLSFSAFVHFNWHQISLCVGWKCSKFIYTLRGIFLKFLIE